jgi:hypothetical protein
MQSVCPTAFDVATRLAGFFNEPFAGKPNGRFRVSPKNLRRIAGRRRISDKFVRELANEMFELGYLFLDMETFYVVTSARTFGNYRRLSDSLVE